MSACVSIWGIFPACFDGLIINVHDSRKHPHTSLEGNKLTPLSFGHPGPLVQIPPVWAAQIPPQGRTVRTPPEMIIKG
jgi:hypothetical protein